MPQTFAERPQARPKRPEADPYPPISPGPTADFDHLADVQKSAERTVGTIDDELARNERTAKLFALGNLIVPSESGTAAPTWLDADAIPEIREARLKGKRTAYGVMEDRMQLLRDGDFAAVPDLVDPLSTAARVRQAREMHGVDSEAYEKNRHSLIVDCQRYLAEVYRKNSYEYFPPIKQEYDEQTGGHQYMGRQLLDMVRDGITPAAEDEEQSYRVAEYVEEVTFSATVRALGGLAVGEIVSRSNSEAKDSAPRPQLEEVSVFTISECADWAIDAYKRNPNSQYGHGYVPSIEKLMIRGVRYDQNGDRYQEQVGVSGKYHTHEIINQALQTIGMAQPGQFLTKEEVRAKQVLNTEGKGVLDFVALLDDLAGKASGENIFMGEVVAHDHPKDYSRVPAEAIERQDKLLGASEEMAGYLLMLEENGTDHGAALGLLDRYIQKTVFADVKNDPKRAAMVFDGNTAATLREARALRDVGDIQGAQQLEMNAEQNAPPAGGCGAGSCGLVEVDPSSSEGAAMKSKLKAEAGDEFTRDTERACKECGEKGSVYYVYNKTKVNKGCAKCGATEIAGKQKSGKKSDYTLAA